MSLQGVRDTLTLMTLVGVVVVACMIWILNFSGEGSLAYQKSLERALMEMIV
jgi:hypothetical protein